MKKVVAALAVLAITLGSYGCFEATTSSISLSSSSSVSSESSVSSLSSTSQVDSAAPLLLGANDVTLEAGSTWDPLEGLSAIDNVDGNVTSTIQVLGTYDLTTKGTYTITYKVTDKAGNFTEKEITLRITAPILPGFQILNGDFSDPLEEPWGHWAGNGGASTATIIDGVLNYSVTAIGTETWSNQFSQVDREIENGKIYQVSFDAKADNARPMTFQIERRSDYVVYYTTIVEVTTSWVTYSYVIQVTNPTMIDGKVGFFLGKIGTTSVPTTVYLDNVEVTELTELPPDTTPPTITGATDYIVEVGIPFDPLHGVTVKDNIDLDISAEDIVITGDTVDYLTPGTYTLTYTVKDNDDNETSVNRVITVSTTPPASTWLVTNGDMSVDSPQWLNASNVSDSRNYVSDPAYTWGYHYGTGGVFTAELKNGVAEIVISDIGTVAHGVQFYQLGRIVEEGRTYRITFDAKVLNPRPIKVVLEHGTSFVRQFDKDFDVTTEWQTFSFDHYQANPTLTNGKFAFFAGIVGTTSVPTTLYLDNIKVEAISTTPDATNPEILGANDLTIEKGAAFDPLFGVTVSDDRDRSLTPADIVITGQTVDNQTDGVYSVIYTLTDATGNIASVTRKITVFDGMAPSSLVVANNDFVTDQAVAPGTNLGILKWSWHGAGSFVAKIEGGMAIIDVRNPGTAWYGVQFYQNNLVVQANSYYQITFQARADIPRMMRLALQSGSTGFFADVFLTSDWQTFTVYYDNTLLGAQTNVKLGFYLGAIGDAAVATIVNIDNVNVTRVIALQDVNNPYFLGVNDIVVAKDSTFNAWDGVLVKDIEDKTLTLATATVDGTVDTATLGEYTLTYSITDKANNVGTFIRKVTVVEVLPSNPLVIGNSDFSVSAAASTDNRPTGAGSARVDDWTWHAQNTNSTYSIEISDGMLIADVQTANTTSLWTPHVYQLNRVFEPGAIYELTFRAKADIARPISFRIEAPAGTLQYSKDFMLTTEWATYTVRFSSAEFATFADPGTPNGFINGKIAFFMGNVQGTTVATKIYLDDTTIKAVAVAEDSVLPSIYGATNTSIVQGAILNLLTGVTVYDYHDRTLVPASIVITGTGVSVENNVYSFDSSVIGEFEITYTLTDRSGNIRVVTRIVSVTAPANPE